MAADSDSESIYSELLIFFFSIRSLKSAFNTHINSFNSSFLTSRKRCTFQNRDQLRGETDTTGMGWVTTRIILLLLAVLLTVLIMVLISLLIVVLMAVLIAVPMAVLTAVLIAVLTSVLILVLWLAANVAELISLSALILEIWSNSGLGKYNLFSKLSSLFAINSRASFKALLSLKSILAGLQSHRLAHGVSSVDSASLGCISLPTWNLGVNVGPILSSQDNPTFKDTSVDFLPPFRPILLPLPMDHPQWNGRNEGDLLRGVVWVGDSKNSFPLSDSVPLSGAYPTKMPVLGAGPDILLSLITMARFWVGWQRNGCGWDWCSRSHPVMLDL